MMTYTTGYRLKGFVERRLMAEATVGFIFSGKPAEFSVKLRSCCYLPRFPATWKNSCFLAASSGVVMEGIQ